MPDTDQVVYWNVDGAATINGATASSYPEGSLDASDTPTLTVLWNDSVATHRLQLCRRGEGEIEVLAELLTINQLVTNKIRYIGQSTRSVGSVTASGAHDVYVCPNTVDAVTGVVQGEPHSLHFESNCSGTSGNSCTARPNFVWTLIYTAESGNVYKEQVADYTYNDFSKVHFYLYDRVPSSNTATNVSASRTRGNLNVYQWVRPSSCGPSANTAQPGERIVDVRVECSGYRCGFTNGLDEDYVNFPSLYMPPRSIDLLDVATGSTPASSLCRTGSYSLRTSQVYPIQPALNNGGIFYPTYSWRATNGARIVIPASSVRGRPAILDLSNVSPTATDVTVYASYSTKCGVPAYERALTVPVGPVAPAPQNMQLTNGLCPSPNTKTVSVDGATGNAQYEWSISGVGATFVGGPGGTAGPTKSIITLNAGAVTVTARKQLTTCGGFGPPLSTTYQIGNLIPSCVAPMFYPGDHCGNSPRLVFERVPSGLQYFVGAITNPSIPGITLTPTFPGSPVWNINGLTGIGIVTFNLQYTVYSPCPAGVTSCSTSVSTGKQHYSSGDCPVSAKSSPPAESLLQLYPNPTSGVVNIKANSAVRYQWLKVFDAQGYMRYEQQSTTPEGLQSFDMRALVPGIYLVQLFDGEHLASQRLVKE